MGVTAWVIVGMMMAGTSGPDESIEVVVRGTVRTGMMAIGGETTGVTIAARGATWELDLSKDPALRAKADALSGGRAVVRGSLEVRPGVERRQRWIVTVTAIEPAGPPAAK
jgi:hypothetical protein